jgi:hypothetical protein
MMMGFTNDGGSKPDLVPSENLTFDSLSAVVSFDCFFNFFWSFFSFFGG